MTSRICQGQAAAVQGPGQVNGATALPTPHCLPLPEVGIPLKLPKPCFSLGTGGHSSSSQDTQRPQGTPVLGSKLPLTSHEILDEHLHPHGQLRWRTRARCRLWAWQRGSRGGGGLYPDAWCRAAGQVLPLRGSLLCLSDAPTL